MRADRPQLEIAVTSATAAAQAIGHGADRVELCVALETGGVTPSQALVEATLATGAESHVLVRSRPGDFLYEPDEVALMAQEAATLVRAGVHGVVIGALTEAHTLDLSAMRIMADAARAVRADVSVTIHRCIDASRDPIEAAAALAADRHLAPTRILTSGGRPAAGDAADTIAQMVSAAGAGAGTPIQVMAGGGVTIEAVRQLLASGVAAVHMSAKRPVRDHHELAPELVTAARDRIDAHVTGHIAS